MTAKKNNTNNNRTRRRAKGGIPSTLQVVPSAFKRAFFAYSDYRTLTEGAANLGGAWAYRLNSIYDPDSAGVGTTALGYDAMYRVYSTFRVLRARVILSMGLTTSGNAMVGIAPGLAAVAPANFNLYPVEPNVTSKMVQGNVGGAKAIAVIDRVIDLPKICGLTKAQYMTDMDFAHAAGSNPVRPVYLTLFMVGLSAAAQTAFWNIRIIYEVELSNPNQYVVS
jgi:hypothetical protein